MITLKEIAKPNAKTKAIQTVYEFYNGSKLIGKAVFMPTIWKSKLSLEIRHDNDSAFYRTWKSNWQSGGQSTFSKPNALKEFKHWYEFLTEQKDEKVFNTPDGSGSTPKFRDWDILECLPEGWVIDKYCGSPLYGFVFCTNGKSILNGGKRALVRVKQRQDNK